MCSTTLDRSPDMSRAMFFASVRNIIAFIVMSLSSDHKHSCGDRKFILALAQILYFYL